MLIWLKTDAPEKLAPNQMRERCLIYLWPCRRRDWAMVGGGIAPMPAGNKECYAVAKIHQKPILNTSLPAQFRQIRLVLAREPGHPEGDAEVAYVIVAPLDPEDRLDAKLWRKYRDACRIVRQRPGQHDQHGYLVQRPGGGWAIHYHGETNHPDEVGYHFANERFIVGEYVSINEGGKMHTYRVSSVSYI
jgi:hypothetical protein